MSVRLRQLIVLEQGKMMMGKLVWTIILGCLMTVVAGCCRAHSSMSVADVYGKCPKCGTMVGGFPAFWDGHDARGNPVSGTYYSGTCGSCRSALRTTGDSTGTNVVWREATTK